MIDWIGYGWIAGELSGPNTYFADLTIEVPRGDVVAAARIVGGHRVVALPKDSRLPIDSILDRSAGEAARFLRVRPLEIETIRARSQGKGAARPRRAWPSSS